MAAKTEKKGKSATSSKTGKSTGRKTAVSGGQKKKSTPVRQKERVTPVLETHETANPLILKEAVVWLFLAVCIFIFISFFGVGGYVGLVISDVCFGIFGFPAYLLPFLIFIAVVFLISNRGSRVAGIKFASAVGLYLCICSLMELFVNGYQPKVGIGKLYLESAALKTGGGAAGGIVCSLLCPAIGTAGASLILAILSIICIVLLTQKSLFAGMKHQSEKVYHNAVESKERRAIRQQERREAAMRRRESEQQQREQLQQKEKAQQAETRIGLNGRRKKEPLSDIQEDPQHVYQQGTEEAPGDVHFFAHGPIPEQADGYVPQAWTEPVADKGKKKSGKKRLVAEEPQQGISGGRTQLEVPVIFPAHPRESRMERRIRGVTRDTRIETGAQQYAGEVHEIVPKVPKRKASVSAFPEPKEETCYIDLNQEKPQQEYIEISGLEVSHENGGSDEIRLPRHAEEENAEWYGGTRECEEYGSDLQENEEYETIPEETDGYAGDSGADRIGSMDFAGGEEDASDFEHSVILQLEGSEDKFTDYGLETADEESENSVYRSGNEVPPWDSDDGNGAESGIEEVSSQKADDRSLQKVNKAKRSTGSDASETAGPAEHSGGGIKKNPRSSVQEIQEGIASVEAEMAKAAEAVKPQYVYPPLSLLKKGKGKGNGGQEQEIRKTAAKLEQTLNSFGVHVTVTNVSCGPSVTRYELQPEQGVKVSRIVSLADDIKLNLAAADIRIEAPIPGKAAVGIEVPNAENSSVMLRDLLESEEFQKHPSRLAFATGKDIGGKVVVSDIAKMPHLLIAGATGSGKSVCINTLIMSILYKAKPDEVKLIMIDPKVVELSVYNGIPHLFIPVVTDPKKAAGALNWGVAEMTDRYNKFAEMGVRDLKGYNQKIEAIKDIEAENKPQKLPQIVIIVDELADLMMVAPGEVEDSICRLAQLARAAGIHLIIATQRPSVNVITGLIKANMPSRIAFSVSSGVDSRTIIDMNGAEKLLGKGDMLFYPQGYQKPARVQGAFVSDEEVSDVVDFLKNKNMDEAYNAEMEAQIAKVQQAVSAVKAAEDVDALFVEAGKFIIEKDKASIGMLQRVFKIGFNRAARIMDQLSEAGVVGPEEGTKPRKILMSQEQFENMLEEGS